MFGMSPVPLAHYKSAAAGLWRAALTKCADTLHLEDALEGLVRQHFESYSAGAGWSGSATIRMELRP